MNTIPEDLFKNITKYLSYNKAKYINDLLRWKYSKQEIFENSISDFQNTKNVLKYMCIEIKDLYDIIENSSFDVYDVYHMINKIENNLITNKNKYETNFTYKYKKEANENEIQNTITCVKIVLNMIAIYTRSEFTINNPYIYLHTSICNMITDYTIMNMRKEYKHIDCSDIMKYKMLIFQMPWYYTDMNIYDVLKVLLNKSQSKLLEKIAVSNEIYSYMIEYLSDYIYIIDHIFIAL